ncbi:interferon-induced very large GTPase 1-like isoform X3 [Lithobates pipiens]
MKMNSRILLGCILSIGCIGVVGFFLCKKKKKTEATSGKGTFWGCCGAQEDEGNLSHTERSRGEKDDVESFLPSIQDKNDGKNKSKDQYQLITEEDRDVESSVHPTQDGNDGENKSKDQSHHITAQDKVMEIGTDVESSVHSTQDGNDGENKSKDQSHHITAQDKVMEIDVESSVHPTQDGNDGENKSKDQSHHITAQDKVMEIDVESSVHPTQDGNDGENKSKDQSHHITTHDKVMEGGTDVESSVHPTQDGNDGENKSKDQSHHITAQDKVMEIDVESSVHPTQDGNDGENKSKDQSHHITAQDKVMEIDVESSVHPTQDGNDGENKSKDQSHHITTQDKVMEGGTDVESSVHPTQDGNDGENKSKDQSHHITAQDKVMEIEECFSHNLLKRQRDSEDSFVKTEDEKENETNEFKSSKQLKLDEEPDIKEDLLFLVRKIRRPTYANYAENNQAFYFLSKLMALERTARNYIIPEMIQKSEEDMDFDTDIVESSSAANPLDVLCDVHNICKNYISQQEIVTKMSMCQFAIPLLLPPSGDNSHCTFMLWAMRDIVKRWRPQSLANLKGFKEDNLVNICMPICSFVRLGSCNLSKSNLLNHVLSSALQTHHFFVHRDMDGGNIMKRSSDGLVEISWYFPSGQKGIDVFSEPIAVTNLRGDLESHNQQLQFLLSISTAMFIFVESINEEQYQILSGLSENKDTHYFLVVNGSDKKPGDDTLKYLKNVSDKLKLKKTNIIIKKKNGNDSQIASQLQTAIKYLITNDAKKLSLQKIAHMEIWNKSNIAVDEDFCESAKRKAKEITDHIKDITQFKKEEMKLQGDLWRQLTKVEKEVCRLKELGDRDPEEYKSQLQSEIHHLRTQQRYQTLADSIQKFVQTMAVSPSPERQLFLKWLKIYLDEAGRNNLSMLQAEYREKHNDLSGDASELKNIDQRIADSSLGVEHFLRELGQFYEAAQYMKKKDQDTDEIHSKLPKIASGILLDGYPLELIDGDTSNIPLQWITDVLKETDIKTGGKCRIRVITVLGVQSTGKSTLLNTMFGLQLPVASGRCTRGAFMTLLTVDETFQKDLGCQFLLLIDTEGLKSLELASLDGSYEHDNEIATVVVGLSDITIVNMAMENTEEIKDILQIVVYAFLRMKEVGKKPSCQFVHQNVSDVSAHAKNQRARQKFLEQLNELTRVAAKTEKRSDVTCFSDIINCDLEAHSCYIPGLWYGIPPMASINIGYSETVQELKKSIIETLQSMPGKPQTILEFTEWLKSLWNAVKHEKFIFSFRNRLVTEAYNELCMEYSDWEWRFQKHVHHWMIKTETSIYNLPSDKLGEETWNTILYEIKQLLDTEERNMLQSLENYFEHDYNNSHLLDMFRGDFFRSVNYLRKELENTLIDKCEKAMQIQREKCEIQAMQEKYINIIEVKVAEIMEEKRRNKNYISPEQLEREFDMMWKSTLDTLQLSELERLNIEQIIIQQLKQDMRNDEQALKKLDNITSFAAYEKEFKIDKEHHLSQSSEELTLMQNLACSLLHECTHYVSKCANTRENFNEILSQELLKIINRSLNNQEVRHFSMTIAFNMDLKLHILGNAAPKFQKMHNDFVQRNDPRSCLEMLKPEYFSIFQSMFEKRNECQRRAEQFCELCLKPAIIDHINRHLGKEIVEEILQKGGPWEFKSHTVFQSVLLEELLKNKSCEEYINYINVYEDFVEKWISQYILKYYNGQSDIQALQFGILQSLTKKIIQALKNLSTAQVSSVSAFLAKFCNILKKDLVISQNNLKVVAFQSYVDVGKFINDIEAFLPDLQQVLQMGITSVSVSSVLSQLNLKPQEELAKKVIGCGKKCPFCKAPCEAGGADHKEHFSSIHRPMGLAQHNDEQTGALDHTICSTNVISNRSFSNADTNWKPHPYKDYQTIYPNWAIYSDTTADRSDYWKFVFAKFNQSFAEMYRANPANPPKDWYRITEDQALKSLKIALNTHEKNC